MVRRRERGISLMEVVTATSIAVDASRRAYISYYNDFSANMMFATRAFGAPMWTIETVQSSGLVGTHSSIGVDAAGTAHVVYFDEINADLRYARRPAAGGWTTSLVDGSSNTGLYTSLAVDAAGALHVSYFDAGANDLRYAYRSSAGAWTLSAVDTVGAVGRYTSIALDGAGGTHIAYDDFTAAVGSHLRHAYRPSGGAWSLETVESYNDVGSWTSTAVDLDGRWHILHYDATEFFARHVWREPY